MDSSSRIPVHSLLTETSHQNGRSSSDRRSEITAVDYLKGFGEDNFNDISPEVKEQVERLGPILLKSYDDETINAIGDLEPLESYRNQSINAIEDPEPHKSGSPESYQNEWIIAIEHPEPYILPQWFEDPNAFWRHYTKELPPARVEDFLAWSALSYMRYRQTHFRQVVLYLYAEIINSWNPYGKLKATAIDRKLASYLPWDLKKITTIRQRAEKYHTVISQLSPGVVFMKSLSDKAERIGVSDLQAVVFECINSRTYEQRLGIYDDLAVRIFKTVTVKE